jgi:hypothetical protein
MGVVGHLPSGVTGDMPCIFGDMLTGCTGDILMG